MSKPIYIPSAKEFLDRYLGKEGTEIRSEFTASVFEKQCIEYFADQQNALCNETTRRDAIDAFLTLGLPSKKNEAWKYTNVGNWLKPTFNFNPPTSPVSISDLEAFQIPELDAYRVVLVNGIFQKELSELTNLPNSVIVMSLKEAVSLDLEGVSAHFGKIADSKNETFVALNHALIQDGLFIQIGKGKMLDKPIHLFNLVQAESDVLVQTRLLCIAEAGGSAHLIESRITSGDAISFTNTVSEFVVAKNANVQYHLIQDGGEKASQVNHLQVLQTESSVFTTTTTTLSGDLVRNNANFLPNAEFCETNLFSALVGKGKMHVDNATFVDHALPNGESNELYKHVLTDNAVGIFNGKIMVRQDAQKTNAYQSNKTILDSDTAKIYAKPELEIYADDVKCSHGAATGKLDDIAMFYLRARGLSEKRAKRMLLLAFLGEVVDKFSNNALKNYVSDQIANKL